MPTTRPDMNIRPVDATAQKGAEAALRESEERFRTLVESAPEAIFVQSQGRFVYLNPATLRLFGAVRPEELLGTDCLERVAPECREAVLERTRLQGETGNPAPLMEQQYVRLDGSRVPVETTAVPIPFQGHAAHMVFVRDISERKKAEQAMRVSEERYRAIIENSAQGMALISGASGKIEYVNQALCRILGLRPEELLGQDLALLHSTPSIPMARGQAGRPDARMDMREVCLSRGDGSSVYVDVATVPLSIEGIAGQLVLVTDLTAQRENQMHREKLMQADKLTSLGTLVAGVAHEINNPTSFITLNTPVLKEAWTDIVPILDGYYRDNGDFLVGGLPYSEMKDRIPELFEGVTEGASRIVSIVSELKDFARISPSDFTEEVDINGVVRSASMILNSLIIRQTQAFSVEYGRDLPVISGASRRLEQVVLNVIKNACESLPVRSCAVSVKTGLSADRNGVFVEVRDEGCGIPEELLPQVADPFFTTKRDIGGTGLGLAVSMGIVNEHGGTLDIQSELGKGTTVLLTLPCVGPAGRRRRGGNPS